MRRYAIILVSSFVLTVIGIKIAGADNGAATVQVDAGPAASPDAAVAGTGPGTSSLAPLSQLHDPLEAPLAALDDARAARKTSWPLAVFAVLAMVTKALAYGAKALQGLPVIGAAAKWLATDKHAMWVAGLGTLAAAGYNTLATGGTWVALLVALGVAAAGLTHSTTQPAKEA